MSKKFDEIWVLKIIVNMLITAVLWIIFANNSKIRIIIVLKMKKAFRKKVTAIILIINIYSLTINSNNNRVKRNFLLFINSTIFYIKIVFIKINQIIAFNNSKNRRKLKQINYTKKFFRNCYLRISRTNSLNLCFRFRFNQKTRSFCNLNYSNRRNRIVFLTIISIINIKIDRFIINVLICQQCSNAFI